MIHPPSAKAEDMLCRRNLVRLNSTVVQKTGWICLVVQGELISSQGYCLKLSPQVEGVRAWLSSCVLQLILDVGLLLCGSSMSLSVQRNLR